MTTTTKRANFDLSPEQEELLANLRTQLAASSTKEAVLKAAQLTTLLLDEVQQGEPRVPKPRQPGDHSDRGHQAGRSDSGRRVPYV